MSDPGGLPRELALASAGSGKTWQLSSRMVALLALGVPPEEILASTFTRKAAGEILDRVLLRLAEGARDEGKAAELAGSTAGYPGAAERLTREGCGTLLLELSRGLHRLQVFTLDAFFQRALRGFSLELGLPGDWKLADELEMGRLRSRAVETVLAEGGGEGRVAELLLAARAGGTGRAVHRDLLRWVEELHQMQRELDPGAPEPWGFPQGEEGWGAPPSPARLEGLARELEGAEVPLTASGRPDNRWRKAVDGVAARIRARDWPGLLKSSFVWNAVADEGGKYYGREYPEELTALVQELLEGVRALLGPQHHRRTAALGELVRSYDQVIRRMQRREGRYGFGDLTHALLEAGTLGVGDALYYRLDGHIRHALLDEFQDTSAPQWRVLRPLLEEILSGYQGERALFIVADPKQSIYGWRGGEPGILEALAQDFPLQAVSLAKSWRSSPVVLGVVNRIFRDVAGNPVFKDPVDQEAARAWQEGFVAHEAARPGLPGFVEIAVGPGEEEGGGRGMRRALLQEAARRAAALHRAVPGATIGILTRTNKPVPLLMAVLREEGIEASEEGGVPVADSAPVLALLALLRLADHPGDVTAAYLVAKTPLGELVGFREWSDAGARGLMARKLRRQLLDRGLGPSVAEWARRVDPALAGQDRDRRRLRQLTEMAFQWGEREPLRPGEFVRWVEGERREDPASAPVRIMTVHRAKGLEFDVVILPELYDSLTRGPRGEAFPFRAIPGGPVVHVFPGIPSDQRPLFPEVHEVWGQLREAALGDALSTLYVAVTRARYAVHLLLPPDGKQPSKSQSAALLLRNVFRPEGRVEEGEVLHRDGDPGWWSSLPGEERARVLRPPPAGGVPGFAARAVGLVPLAPSPRRRLLPRRSPSELEGGDQVELGAVLRPRHSRALEEGTVVHAWMEGMEWWEAPDPARLLETARRVAPGLKEPQQLLAQFLEWLEVPAIRSLLLREHYPAGTVVIRERPFVVRRRGEILQGVADRVVRIPDPSGDRLLVVDWKTDRLAPGDAAALAARALHYAPQLEAYMEAMSRVEGVPRERVEGLLAFLVPGAVWRSPEVTARRR